MKKYQKLLRKIKREGTRRDYRKGSGAAIGTKAIFGYQETFDLRQGFPLVTTKKIKFDNIVNELLWFISGNTNVRPLIQEGTNIWNDNLWQFTKKYVKAFEQLLEHKVAEAAAAGEELEIDEYWVPDTREELLDHLRSDEPLHRLPIGYEFGNLGHVYPSLWRAYPKASREGQPVDQLENLLSGLLVDPMGRRHIVNAWHPGLVEDHMFQALPPCHVMFQVFVDYIPRKKLLEIHGEAYPYFKKMTTKDIRDVLIKANDLVYYMDLQMYQRSADAFLGVPYNWASYALLTHILAKCTNMVARNFIWTAGDVHIYNNHWNQVDEVLAREPRKSPTLLLAEDISTTNDFFAITSNEIGLENYNPHPFISAKMAVNND